MAMTSTKLKDELVKMVLYTSEDSAIVAWGKAFRDYFENAESNGIPITPVSLDPCEAAMTKVEIVGGVRVGPMVGISSTGADAITAGIQAFWTALLPAAFAGATLITPPPGLGGISAALLPVFSANTIGKLSKENSMIAIASAIHTINVTGGTATFPGPITAPIL